MKRILIISFIIIIPELFFGQSPGLVIQAGLSASYAKDVNITKAKQGHYGWMLGADARILDGDLYFLAGAQFHKTDLMSTSSPDFFKNDWSIIMGRAGFGFNLLHINERIVIRSKLLGSINFIIDSPLDGLNIVGYTELNDSYLGATTGIGLTIGSFDFDLDFQYGFINAYFMQPKSTFDSWTFMAGFHF